MYIKKITALICIICLFCAALPAFTFASEEGSATDYAIEIDFLNKIGILKASDSLAKKEDTKGVTRAEFAVLIYRALNNTISNNTQKHFNDVLESASEYTAINTLAENGILSGIENGNFDPDSEIEFYDSISIMLRLMGYQNFSEHSNSIFVMETCRKYKLLSNSDLNNNKSDKKAILKVFYNLLNEDVYDVVKVNEEDDKVYGTYETSNDTILSRYFDIYKIEGILYSDGIVDITGANVDDKQIKVDDLSIKISEQVSAEAGARVDVYYKDENAPELYAIYENDKTDKKELIIDEYTSFKNYVYEYIEGSKTRKITINAANTTFTYNNTLLSSSDESFLLPEYGRITFIDNDNNGSYDVVHIKAYTSFLISRTYSEDDYVILGDNDGYSVYVSENEPCIIKNTLGNIITADKITSGVVASCAVIEKDGKNYAKEVILSDKTVTGAIQMTKTENTKINSVTINDTEYGVYTKNLKIQSKLYPNDSKITYCLDFMGKIVDINYSSGLGNVAAGYVVKIGEVKDSFNNKAGLYIYDELGRLRKYTCAEKVKIDGVTEKNNILNILTNKKIVDGVILFRVDEEDEINYIDTAGDYTVDMQITADNKLIKAANDNNESSGRGLYYSEGNYSLGGCVNLSDNTIIFKVPSDPQSADEDEFGFYTVSDLIDAAYYPVQGYFTNPDSAICDVAVIKDTKRNFSTKNGTSVVTNIGEGINSKGEKTYSLEIYDIEGSHSFVSKNKAVADSAYSDVSTTDKTEYKVDAGDLVRYTVDANNEVNQIIIVYDKSKDKLYSNLALRTSYSYGHRVFSAIPYSIAGGYVRFIDASKTDFSSLSANDFEYISISKINKVFKVKKYHGAYKVEEISPQELKTYKTDGGNCLKAIINLKNQANAIITVYEEG